MRRQHLTQLIGTLVVTTALVGLPTVAFAAIAGGPHDLATELTTPQSQTCIVCHTPHNADGTETAAPLWNHEVTAVATYTLYDSLTLDATTAQPTGVSKLCLSCHDGTVAVDNYGGVTTGTLDIGAGVFSDTPAFGADLSNDHPISFTYNTALSTTDDGLENPSVALSGLAGGGTIDADLLFSGNLECASCHDVHNDEAVAEYLLVKANTDSDLCLTCHIK